MKIHILTSCFYPELHPRAFRAFELARAFARQGDDVLVSVLTQVNSVDYKKMQEEYGFRVDVLGIYQREIGETGQTGLSFNSTNPVLQLMHRLFRLGVEYFLAGNLFHHARKIADHITISEDTDLFIALSTPFMDVLAGALYRRKNGLNNTIFIADSGDPFSGSQQTKRAIYMRWLEKWVYRFYDFLTIPTEGAIPAYNKVIEREKIRIIPQGFDFGATPIQEYKKNAVPTFAYAGVFYKDIRNPEFLLHYLAEQKMDFRFYIYLRHQDAETETILNHYRPALGKRLIVKYGIERKQLICELSTYDFLVNVGNNNSTQLPSKLIDYGITRRPVFHCTADHFDKKMWEEFMQGDFHQAREIDIAPYAIETIIKQLKALR